MNWKTHYRIFIILTLLLFILINILSIQYNQNIDITSQKINSLSKESLSVLKDIQSPVQVIAFVRGDPKTKNLITRIISRYQDQNKNIKLQFKNPDTAIELVKKYQIKQTGTLAFRYQGKTVVTENLSEQSITNALQNVQNIKKPTISFLTGHQERGLDQSPSNYQTISNQLKKMGFLINQQNLAQQQKVTDNTDLLVIAEPKTSLSSHDIKLINQYIDLGKNLLILSDTESTDLSRILNPLNLQNPSDKINNQSGEKYHLKQKDYLVISAPKTNYPPLKEIDSTLLFPQALVIDKKEKTTTNNWQQIDILRTTEKSYRIGKENIESNDQGYRFGIENNRLIQQKKQRIILIGDADFLSNQFIGNGQNLLFGQKLFSYLAQNNYHIVIKSNYTNQNIVLSNTALYYLTLLLMVIIPVTILLLGFLIKRRR